MKFVFDRIFKFAQYPSIRNCHIRYNELVDKAYEVESKYESGECKKDSWIQALNECDSYISEYARVVHDEFYGKGLKICHWKTKQVILFDDVFIQDFENMSKDDKNDMVSIVEVKYGWKLSSKFYEK